MDIEFRKPVREEIGALVLLGEQTGIFGPGETQELLGQTLIDYLDQKLPESHHIYVLQHEKLAKGWAYYSPTEEEGIYNLWWIGVDPKFHGQGFGKKLLKFVENSAKASGATQLLIETSSSAKLTKTREFYKRAGYHVSSADADCYGPGEDKVSFKQALH